MRYKFLGRTGVRVSTICLGTMSFGDEADEATSAAIYHCSREAGINISTWPGSGDSSLGTI
jgi:aryl-alcohol dehydrogenase-like predicted oxidoreductase